MHLTVRFLIFIMHAHHSQRHRSPNSGLSDFQHRSKVYITSSINMDSIPLAHLSIFPSLSLFLSPSLLSTSYLLMIYLTGIYTQILFGINIQPCRRMCAEHVKMYVTFRFISFWHITWDDMSHGKRRGGELIHLFIYTAKHN